MNNFETIIGVEVHAQLNTKHKIFSPALNDSDSKPNTNVHPIDIAYPGTLPRFNPEVLEKSLKICKALNMNISKEMHWDRKNYFYYDNPKGYQITQFETPIGKKGYIELDDGTKIDIDFMHMEEDTAKTYNSGDDINLDYNRSGVPLVEIVTAPVLKTGEQTKEYLEKLRDILVFLDVCDGKLEKGSFRVDVNVSVRLIGDQKYNTKVEIKNLNSYEFIKRAIDEETKIQIKKYLTNEKVVQSTKRFNDSSQKLELMRIKEGAADYRYFPEPDLPIININDAYIENIVSDIGMLPLEIKKMLINKYELPKKDVNILINNKQMTDFFLSTLSTKLTPKKTLNYLLVNTLEYLNKNKVNFEEIKLSTNNLLDIDKLLNKGMISSAHVKKIFPYICKEETNVLDLVKKLGIEQITNPEQIRGIILSVLEIESESVELYKSGKSKAFGFLIGKIIAQSAGQANPKIVNELLKEELDRS